MQKEFSCPERIVVAEVAVGIRPDMGIEQESLAIFNDAIGVLQVSFTFADGFNFGAAQGDSAFKSVEQEVVMAGGAVYSGVALASSQRISRFVFGGGLSNSMCGLPGHGRRSEISC